MQEKTLCFEWEGSVEMHTIRTKKDLLWDTIIVFVLIILAFVALYPFIYVLSMSLSDPVEALQLNISFLPKGFSLESYKLIIQNPTVWRYYYNTIWYTAVGVFANIIVTVTFAYPLSRKDFCLKKFYSIFLAIPMFISGGMVPTFLLISNLGLYNTRWALIFPSAMSLWICVMARVYFQTTVPDSLVEAAKLDGCSDVKVLTHVVVPISKPILSVVALYNAVSFWNLYMNALLYIVNEEIQPLQVYLNRILILNSPDLTQQVVGGMQRTLYGNQIKFSIIIFSILPIICLYPLLQKYFVKGVMVGSLKG